MKIPVPRILLCAFVGDLSMHVALGSFSYRAQALGATPDRLGWVQGVADLVYCVIALVLPRFLDSKSRALVVRGAALVMAAGGALCWQAESLGGFVGALILLRAGTALFWPTLEARMSDEHFADLGRAVSAFSLSWSFGKALGYGVNAVLFSREVAPATSFVITAGGSLVLLALAPRDHAREDQDGEEAGRRLRAPFVRVLAAWAGVFLACGAFIVLQNQNAPLMAAKAHSGSFGNLLLAVLVGFNMLMFEVLRRRPALAGADGALIASTVLLFAGVVAMLVSSLPGVLLAGAALIGTGMGLAYTQSLFLSLGLPHGKSVSAGIHEAFIGLANASLAPLAGLATGWHGNANGALLFAVVLLGAGGFFVLACVRRARRALSAGPSGGSLPSVGAPGFVRTRKDLEEAERSALAPYGMRSADSRGRRHREAPDDFRTDFQRDRDRVLHSTAFRRLIGKTQVFVSDTGDHYRTRLTHSLEVSQIARSIARSLGLNQDLTEGVALAHDLGHAPFGHSGGDVLDELMKDHGGFEHNRQSARILDYLEVQYPGFTGLNLTYEVKESILKHKRPFDGPDYAGYRPEESPLLEAQLVDVADGIAYNSHDLDDGIRSGILDPAGLDTVPLLARVKEEVRARHPGLGGKALVSKVVAGVINFLVRDLLEATAQRLQDLGIESVEDVRKARQVVVALSPEVVKAEAGLRRWLYQNFYTHDRVQGMRHRSKVFLTALFESFVSEPQLLPERFRELAKTDGVHRAAADYIAGMTDGYAQRIYRRLFDPRHEEP